VIGYLIAPASLMLDESSMNHEKVQFPEAGFLSNEFVYCTSETIKARSFLVAKIFLFCSFLVSM
jgi:hypothetical protein